MLRALSHALFHVIAPFSARGRDQWRYAGERADNAGKIHQESRSLAGDEQQMPVAREKKFRSHFDGEGGSEGEEKEAGLSSMLTMTSSSSLRLAGGDFTTRVVTGSRVECQLSPREKNFAPAARRGYSGAPLPREDDVFFRPGVHLLAMRTSQLVIL